MSDEHFESASADRAPTAEEAQAAEQAASEVDVHAVGENFRAMTELGAQVKGEGQIEPD